MKYYYFDSSALVKRYAPEKGIQKGDEIFQGKDQILIIGNIGIVEIYSAKFLELDNSHLLKGKNLLLKHDTLRTYDALHLSLVLDLKALKVILVSCDQILNEAAIAEGITTLNPEKEIEESN